MSATPCEVVSPYYHIQHTRRGDYLIKWCGWREVGRVPDRDSALATARQLERERRERSEAAADFNRRRDSFIEAHPELKQRTLRWQDARDNLYQDALRDSRHAQASRTLLYYAPPCAMTVVSGYAESRVERAEREAEQAWDRYNNACALDTSIKTALFRLDIVLWKTALTEAGV